MATGRRAEKEDGRRESGNTEQRREEKRCREGQDDQLGIQEERWTRESGRGTGVKRAQMQKGRRMCRAPTVGAGMTARACGCR